MGSSVFGHKDTTSAPGLAHSAGAGRRWPLRAVAIAYAASALIVFVSIVVQFVTAGTGMFAPHAGLSWEARWQAHVTYGTTWILFGSILLIALSFVTRQPWRWTGVAALVLVLFFVQGLLIRLYETGNPVLQLIAGLHVVIAGVMFWFGLVLSGHGVDTARSAVRGQILPGAGR